MLNFFFLIGWNTPESGVVSHGLKAAVLFLFMEHGEERGCREINHNILGFLFFSDGTPEGYGERGKHPSPGL